MTWEAVGVTASTSSPFSIVDCPSCPNQAHSKHQQFTRPPDLRLAHPSAHAMGVAVRLAMNSGRGAGAANGAANVLATLLYTMNRLVRGYGVMLFDEPCIALQSNRTAEPGSPVTTATPPPASTSAARLAASGTPISWFRRELR